MLDEICQRTPSYNSFQQEKWLTCCNEPCAFLGYGENMNLQPFADELKYDLAEYGYKAEDLQVDMLKNGGLGVYLFQCCKCKKHRIHIDYD